MERKARKMTDLHSERDDDRDGTFKGGDFDEEWDDLGDE
jgi:hypothetical protein